MQKGTKQFKGKYSSLKEAIDYSENNIGKINYERTKKCLLLFDYYSLTPGDWQGLSNKLAEDYIPGFQPKLDHANAPPIRWNDFQLLILYWEVNRISRQINDQEAIVNPTSICRQLAKKHNLKERVLIDKFSESKNSIWVQLIEWIRNYLPESSKEEIELQLEDLIRLVAKQYPKSEYPPYFNNKVRNWHLKNLMH